MSRRIRLAVADGIGRLTFADEGRRNAIDLRFCREWERAADTCARDASLRLIVIEAEGALFSVGGDIAAFAAHADALDAYVAACIAGFHGGIRALMGAPAPVLLALGGVAAGGAFSLVCGADMVVARASAKLVSGYTKTGLTPDGGLSWLLPRRVGPARAFDIIASNRPVGMEEALALGLVARVCDDADFEEEVERVAAALAAVPAGALGAVKRLLREAQHAGFDAQLEAERIAMTARAGLPDTRDRVRGFLAGR